MAIGAHPDDIEIGAGGLICAMVKARKRVVLVDATDGEPTPHGTVPIRAKEAAKASKILGVTQRVTLDIRNREIFDTVENREKLAVIIRQYRPRLILAPYWDDGHPDHIELAKLCISSAFYAKFVKTSMPFQAHQPRRLLHYFSLHIRAKFTPSFVFDISHQMGKKMRAVAAYHSQFGRNPKNGWVMKAIEGECAYWGSQIGCAFGEPYISREHVSVSSIDTVLNA